VRVLRHDAQGEHQFSVEDDGPGLKKYKYPGVSPREEQEEQPQALDKPSSTHLFATQLDSHHG
jgi:hypothetical protein